MSEPELNINVDAMPSDARLRAYNSRLTATEQRLATERKEQSQATTQTPKDAYKPMHPGFGPYQRK